MMPVECGKHRRRAGYYTGLFTVLYAPVVAVHIPVTLFLTALMVFLGPPGAVRFVFVAILLLIAALGVLFVRTAVRASRRLLRTHLRVAAGANVMVALGLALVSHTPVLFAKCSTAGASFVWAMYLAWRANRRWHGL